MCSTATMAKYARSFAAQNRVSSHSSLHQEGWVCTFAGDACAAVPVPKAANALNAPSRGLSPGVDMLLRSTPA